MRKKERLCGRPEKDETRDLTTGDICSKPERRNVNRLPSVTVLNLPSSDSDPINKGEEETHSRCRKPPTRVVNVEDLLRRRRYQVVKDFRGQHVNGREESSLIPTFTERKQRSGCYSGKGHQINWYGCRDISIELSREILVI